MTTTTWVSAGGNRVRCTLHPDVEPWPRRNAGGCASCAAAGVKGPGIETAAQAEEHLEDAPSGCRTLEQRERKLTELADFAAAQARAAVKRGKSNPTQTVAIKWFAEAVKAERAAADLTAPRERRRRTRRLEGLGQAILFVGRKRHRGGPN